MKLDRLRKFIRINVNISVEKITIDGAPIYCFFAGMITCGAIFTLIA